MRILRFGAVVGIAAGLVGSYSVAQRHIGLGLGLEGQAATRTTYYIRPGGSDTAAGTSPATAWRTLARASRANLRPGVRLLLLGGHQYQGPLLLGTLDGGRAAKPVLISSYGTGQATIVSATSGITVYDTAGFTIRSLAITGSHARHHGGAGVLLYSNLSGRMLDHVAMSHLNISGFQYGISIGAVHDGAGFRHVWVTRSALHANLDGGMISYGPDFNPATPGYAHEDIYVTHVRAFGNLGDPTDTLHNTGSGIELGSVRNAMVTHTVAHHNGGSGGAKREGPIGIWTYDSTHVTLAHDISSDNSSVSRTDGGGFGLDRETSDSVMEYDLSYGNHGAGFLLYSTTAAAAPQSGNVVRFNISYGDGAGHSGVTGGIAAGGWERNCSFYQNTVVLAGKSVQPGMKLSGRLVHVRVLNNIIVAADGPVVAAGQPFTRSNVLLAGNDYFSAARRWWTQWGSATYSSLDAWRAGTRQERVGTKATGMVAAPRFVGPVSGRAGGAGFVLGPHSQLRRAGLDLRLLFHILTGTRTFAGTAYSVARPNIGAQ